MLMRCVIALLAACGLVCLPPNVSAQGNAAVRGVVQDETGIGIAGAWLTLLATMTTLTRKGNADKTGQFAFDDLPAGDYVLHVGAVGFQSADVPVTVASTQPEPLKITLKVGLRSDAADG
jgi:hypothetical protein